LVCDAEWTGGQIKAALSGPFCQCNATFSTETTLQFASVRLELGSRGWGGQKGRNEKDLLLGRAQEDMEHAQKLGRHLRSFLLVSWCRGQSRGVGVGVQVKWVGREGPSATCSHASKYCCCWTTPFPATHAPALCVLCGVCCAFLFCLWHRVEISRSSDFSLSSSASSRRCVLT